MKTLKTILILTLLIGSMLTVKAQTKEQYTFSWATKHNGEQPVMVISNVKKIKSDTSPHYTEKSVILQWQDYFKAEYKDYYDFWKKSYCSDSQKEAETYRRKIMGNWKDKIIKIDDFTYFED